MPALSITQPAEGLFLITEGETEICQCSTAAQAKHLVENLLRRYPRILTRCPACHAESLTVNEGQLMCVHHTCPDPLRIQTIGDEYTRLSSALAKAEKEITRLKRLSPERRS